jgi:hypothetical protein
MVMRGDLERRLTELRGEFDSGRRLEADLQARLSEVQQTMLRVSGAVQVLEELLSTDCSRNGAPADTAVEVPSSA